jgi:hypothetical protein
MALVLEHVLENGDVSDLLVGHVLDQVAALGGDAGLLEPGSGERGERVAEEVEVDPLLVKRAWAAARAVAKRVVVGSGGKWPHRRMRGRGAAAVAASGRQRRRRGRK